MGLFSFLFGPKVPSAQTDSVLPCPHSKVPAARTPSVLSCPHSAEYIILDTETTGLSPSCDKIIQLSAIKYNSSGTPIAYVNTYLNPGCPISPTASAINGITDTMVKDAPTVSQVKEEFLSFIGDSLIVGYNVTFDLRFLYSEFGNAFAGRQYVDALTIARRLLCSPDFKLETVSRVVGFSPDGTFHDSFTDCEAVAAILNHIGDPLDCWSKKFQCSGSTAYRKYSDKHPIITPRIFTEEELKVQANHPLFMKNIVFTGTLSISRSEAAQLAANVGAVVKGGVSGKTDYLVVGEQDISLVGDDGMSTKEEKAYALNQSGKANITILCESEFLALIQQGKEVHI